jgi:hypothetical protein
MKPPALLEGTVSRVASYWSTFVQLPALSVCSALQSVKSWRGRGRQCAWWVSITYGIPVIFSYLRRRVCSGSSLRRASWQGSSQRSLGGPGGGCPPDQLVYEE